MTLRMFTNSESVSNADYLDINFSSAGFTSPPIVSVSINDNVSYYVSNITSTTAKINFSVNFTGTVTYIVRTPTS
jgi:hypothetical protein